ncbi:MAG TPA: helix-turn-helix transcriptional regulator [Acidobacteriaceae bacterium]|nr:helix-turn-helix transcriptional regulator [Acidobacteriaceae bacterium]
MLRLTPERHKRMGADQGPVVQSAILRSELVRLRKKNKLTQEQVARELDWSPSKLIRIEGGHSSVTKVDLEALLRHYSVPDGDQRRLQELNRGAREKAWWTDFRGQVPGPYLNYVGYEAGASYIRQFPGPVVPGLLQTREYAEALTTSAIEAVGGAPVVNLRIQRQTELEQRRDQPRQEYVLDEAVVRRHVGINTDPAIMPNQLRHIADLAAKDDQDVSVRLIPFRADAHPGLAGAFTLLEFDGDLPDLVYLDPGRGELAVIETDSGRVSEYASIFEVLLELALPETESIDFLRNAAEEMLLALASDSS